MVSTQSMGEPDSEAEWELVEAPNTCTDINEDAEVGHEWELAYSSTSTPEDNQSTRNALPGRLALTVVRLELLDRQKDLMHHRVRGPPAFQASLWDVQLPEKCDEQEDNWSVATTRGEEPEDQTLLCELCRILLPNHYKFNEHLRSRKHARRLRDYWKHRPEAEKHDPFCQGVPLQYSSACLCDLHP